MAMQFRGRPDFYPARRMLKRLPAVFFHVCHRIQSRSFLAEQSVPSRAAFCAGAPSSAPCFSLAGPRAFSTHSKAMAAPVLSFWDKSPPLAAGAAAKVAALALEFKADPKGNKDTQHVLTVASG